jgi:ribosomal protein S18 acetylase RimI-like enzyme
MAVHYFQMLAQDELIPANSTKVVTTRHVVPPDGAVNQRFYLEVGRDWDWRDRAGWTLQQWQEAVSDWTIITLTLHHEDQEIGYSEICTREGDIEILNFGLIPECVSQGLGGPALVAVVRHAWDQLNAKRVWLHTCDRDHPNAINNYRRRGFLWYETIDD